MISCTLIIAEVAELVYLPAGRQAHTRTYMFYTYVLKSLKDNHLYIGMSHNVMKRIKEHNSGKTHSTRNRTPFQLIYSEGFDTRLEDRQREKYLKSGIGREFLKKLVI